MGRNRPGVPLMSTRTTELAGLPVTGLPALPRRGVLCLVMRSFLAVAAFVLFLAGVCPRAGAARVHDCPQGTTVEAPAGGLSGYTTITSVRGITCKGALRVVTKKYKRSNVDTFKPGSRFRLGAWTCRVTSFSGEEARARCTRRGRAFRVSYGA